MTEQAHDVPDDFPHAPLVPTSLGAHDALQARRTERGADARDRAQPAAEQQTQGRQEEEQAPCGMNF